jgi:hypothetical protein
MAETNHFYYRYYRIIATIASPRLKRIPTDIERGVFHLIDVSVSPPIPG